MFRHIESTRRGTVDVVKILKPRLIDDPHLDELRAEIRQVFGECGGSHVLLDLGNVEFLSSAVLEMFSSFYRLLNATGGQLRLCGLKPSIADVFRTTNLDRLFLIHADVAEALGQF